MIDPLLFVLRLGLALVFGTAGAAKLFDRSGTRRTLASFGVPAPFARLGAVPLPLAELVVAGALLVPASARWGALAALVLLVVFIGGLANALARGRTPDCHCFGQVHSAPASWKTVARNVLLALAASAVVAGGDGQDVGVVELAAIAVTAAVITLVLSVRAASAWAPDSLRGRVQANPRLAAFGGIASRVGLLGRGARMPKQGLPVGDTAPDFELRNGENERVTLRSLRERAKPTVLIFSDPGCRPCVELLPEIARWQREQSSRVTIAVVTSRPNDPGENQRYTASDVVFQRDREIMAAYAVRDMPSAVLVSLDGSIGTPPAIGADAIRALVDRIAAEGGAA